MNWVTNSGGKPDAMLTLGIISLGVVLVKFFIADISIGPLVFGQLDGMVIAAILTPTLGAYVARRYTDANAKKDDDSGK
jgi:hypothetical protein